MCWFDCFVWLVIFLSTIWRAKNSMPKNSKRSPCQRGWEREMNYGREEAPTRTYEESSAPTTRTTQSYEQITPRYSKPAKNFIMPTPSHTKRVRRVYSLFDSRIPSFYCSIRFSKMTELLWLQLLTYAVFKCCLHDYFVLCILSSFCNQGASYGRQHARQQLSSSSWTGWFVFFSFFPRSIDRSAYLHMY